MVNVTNKLTAIILSVIMFLTLLTLSACGKQGPQGEQGLSGKDGVDGVTPIIGENGNWWIGEVDTGVPAKAQDGRDGVNGKDGTDGKNGTNGKDAITPKFLYNNGMIYVSYDNETSWELLVEIDELLEDGKDGKDGVSIISSELSEYGELIIYYSTGDSQNLGNVVGKDGVNGENGISVTSCSINDKGELVINYSDGKSETIGRVIGTDGKDGVDGTDGINGIDGTNGKDGVSVTSCEINDKGELVISYSNETSQNLGVIVGKNGTNGIDGENGKDGVTPRLKINTDTRQWEVSYDNGITWLGLGFTAIGADGVNGSDGSDGKNGTTPRLRIDAVTNQWQVSYDNGENWEDLGVVATGPAGNDGMATISKIGDDGYWYISKNNGSSWESTGVKAAGSDGSDGQNGSDGRGIAEMEIIDGCLWVTYTDSSKPINIGQLSQPSVDDPDSGTDTVEPYTDGLAFYPLGDGSEHAVSIGNAIYMESIVIPSTYNGKPVTTILPGAFASKDGDNVTLKSIIIPESIVKIGNDAFSFCVALTNLVIPSSVIEIGSYAFVGVSLVTFERSENDIPEGQKWDVGSLGCAEIIWKK